VVRVPLGGSHPWIACGRSPRDEQFETRGDAGQPKIDEALAGREPRKVIYVPGRLINIVV